MPHPDLPAIDFAEEMAYRAAVSSVALSHPEGHAATGCVTCLAAKGDDVAFRTIVCVAERERRKRGDRTGP